MAKKECKNKRWAADECTQQKLAFYISICRNTWYKIRDYNQIFFYVCVSWKESDPLFSIHCLGAVYGWLRVIGTLGTVLTWGIKS